MRSKHGDEQVRCTLFLGNKIKKDCPTQFPLVMWSGRSCPTDPYNFYKLLTPRSILFPWKSVQRSCSEISLSCAGFGTAVSEQATCDQWRYRSMHMHKQSRDAHQSDAEWRNNASARDDRRDTLILRACWWKAHMTCVGARCRNEHNAQRVMWYSQCILFGYGISTTIKTNVIIHLRHMFWWCMRT